MRTKPETCLLCDRELLSIVSSEEAFLLAECQICGMVKIDLRFNPTEYEGVLHLLSGWTRERTEKGEKPLTLLPNDIDPTADGITVEAILSLPSIPRSIDQNMLKLLEAIHRKSRFFGDEIAIAVSHDYTLAYLQHVRGSTIEFRPPLSKLLEQMTNAGWLVLRGAEKNRYELTVEGIRQVERARRILPESIDCFVAMKFGDKLLDRAYREAIAPAIQEAGYVPIQMAHLEHNNNIMDEMLAGIRRSRFMIADLSFQNQNVYFEAGFAQGLGIPVIYTCHEFHADGIKFDTHYTNQIRWVEIDELRVKLKNRILATI